VEEDVGQSPVVQQVDAAIDVGVAVEQEGLHHGRQVALRVAEPQAAEIAPGVDREGLAVVSRRKAALEIAVEVARLPVVALGLGPADRAVARDHEPRHDPVVAGGFRELEETLHQRLEEGTLEGAVEEEVAQHLAGPGARVLDPFLGEGGELLGGVDREQLGAEPRIARGEVLVEKKERSLCRHEVNCVRGSEGPSRKLRNGAPARTLHARPPILRRDPPGGGVASSRCKER